MEIIKTHNKLIINAKIKFYFEHALICIISTIITGFALISLLFAFLFNNKQIFIDDIFIKVLSFFVSFLFTFFLSMWYVFGNEKIIINRDENCLNIIKSNKLYTSKKAIKLNQIRSVEKFKKKEYFPSKFHESISEKKRAFLWIEMGKISVITNIEKITIFNGINNRDCEQALILIKEFLD